MYNMMIKKSWSKILRMIVGSVLGLFIYSKRKDIKKIFDEIIFEKDHWLKAIKKEEHDCENFLVRLKRQFKNNFIPHQENNHWPHFFKPRRLFGYALLILFLKSLTVGLLFAYYPSPAEMANIVTDKIIEMANSDRLKNDIEPLQADRLLTVFAQEKANDMLQREYFSHDTPEGKKPWQWIDRKKYDYVYAGENLAMDFTSAELIHNAFMKSPGHRKNILNPKYKDIGVAVASGMMNGRQTDILVQFFGTSRSELALVSKKNINDIAPKDKSVTATNSSQKVAGESVELVEDPETPLIVIGATAERKNFADFVLEFFDIISVAFLIFLGLALFLNVFIKIKIQHPKLILQTLSLMALIAALLVFKFHFIEKVGTDMLIM
ncbi:CAP domain-containing protein [Candidatus Parcubacteria bacterium]|nr:MAG: CAP domain-containing protein [Candidatus Parcubacteria bacterium]